MLLHSNVSSTETAEEALSPLDLANLNEDQRRAYDIIAWHLSQLLAGENPSPLRMRIEGEGGTGKSRVIQTVTELFRWNAITHILRKAAYTGIAASLIEGQTIHSLCKIGQRNSG
ncbi:hypothetical protein M405DRAFT_792072, partial [Rhizopogon salebrosus TDB-379]